MYARQLSVAEFKAWSQNLEALPDRKARGG
jgi:hypothetical protein